MKQDTILICDDNDLILTMAGFVLKSKGYVVETARNTDEIYRKIENNTPALIFLDLNLPQEGGESVIQNLRSDNKTKNIPVILFSAEENLPEIAAKLMVDGFLRKPFENEGLIAIVNRFIPHII
ncbi:MAG: response regulator [Bacteroidia bacterium]